MADLNPKLGQTVQTQDARQGIVRYIGGLHFAQGDWIGLELADASGKNNGTVKGEQYFSCQPDHGIFVRKASVNKIVKDAAPSPPPKANGNATATARPRPASGITADVARKRQSLMSAGSTGSRLSARSPTKSPARNGASSNSSATSTPRTSTPATTARTSDSSTKSRTSITGRPSVASQRPTSHTSTLTSRTSIGGPAGRPGRPTTTSSRTSVGSNRLSLQSRPTPPVQRPRGEERQPGGQAEESPTIAEAEETLVDSIDTRLAAVEDPPSQKVADRAEDQSGASIEPTRTQRTTSISRTNGVGAVELRAAQQRETEQLKAKIRSLEKQRDDDSDKLQKTDSLQTERDRFEGIIRALQAKLKSTQQEIGELRRRCAEAEEHVRTLPDRSSEHESQLELATLDKEMAEERAEICQMELDALKTKNEELEAEVESLREENKELGSVMSPEEKANAGWLQMQRETQRLRQALVLLRDVSQEKEAAFRSEVKELQDNLDEVEATADMYLDTAEKLGRAEETNRHLMEQLEAAETNDEVVEAMEAQREQQSRAIDELKKQIQEFEEHIQVTDELELFHVDEEKRLHAQLDETEALLNDESRKTAEQDRVIEDLEYTLTKFRDVVQGLQSDIDEVRRSREVSALQADEMSSKSKAMMDLNLRLQTNAAKSQAKVIDNELQKVRADVATKHVEVLSLFVPENFDPERKPVLALLCFGRLRSKASLVCRLLTERLRERTHLASGEELLQSYEVVERMQWIAGVCQRLAQFMGTCHPSEFLACGSALVDVEPVERMVDAWIEALRKDELGADEPEQLKRLQGVLVDLSEKLITSSHEAKVTEMVVQSELVEHYGESIAGQLGNLAKLVQAKLGAPREEDDESLVFDRRMDQLGNKARTVKYLASKVVQQMTGMRNRSLCLHETDWMLFEDAAANAHAISQQIRTVGLVMCGELDKMELEDSRLYSSLIDAMTATPALTKAHGRVNGETDHDVFSILTAQLSTLQMAVDTLVAKSADPNEATEYESGPAPWTIRAKDLKSQLLAAEQTKGDLARAERRNAELISRINEREKTIEEMNMRVEVAEKRTKDLRARDDKDKALREEIDQLRAEREVVDGEISSLRLEAESQMQKRRQEQVELEALRAAAGVDVPIVSGGTIADEAVTKHLELEIQLLETEVSSLQSAVRFLRSENDALRVPVSEHQLAAVQDSWLNPSSLVARSSSNRPPSASHVFQREKSALLSDLIDAAATLKPVRLASSKTPPSSSTASALGSSATNGPTAKAGQLQGWRAYQDTTRYTVLRQREELEKWEDWRLDLLKRAKLASRASPHGPPTNGVQLGVRVAQRLPDLLSGPEKIGLTHMAGEVQIVAQET